MNNKDFNEKYFSDELFSNCCGCSTIISGYNPRPSEFTGRCPQCLEYCDFVTEEE